MGSSQSCRPDRENSRGRCLFGLPNRRVAEGTPADVQHQRSVHTRASDLESRHTDLISIFQEVADEAVSSNANKNVEPEHVPEIRIAASSSTCRPAESISPEAEEKLLKIFGLCSVGGQDRLDKRELLKLCNANADVADFLGLSRGLDVDMANSDGPIDATWDEFLQLYATHSDREKIKMQSGSAVDDPVELTVRDSVGAEHRVKFDDRPLAEQVRDLAASICSAPEEDDYVLVNGSGRDTQSVCSRAQLFDNPQKTALQLRTAREVAHDHITILRKALSAKQYGDVAGQLWGLLTVIHAEPNVAEAIIEEDGLRDIFFVGSASDCKCTDLAMACLCQLLRYQEGVAWLEGHRDVVRCELFESFLAIIFPPSNGNSKVAAQRGVPPQSSLTICLFLLHVFPDCASELHTAALLQTTGVAHSDESGFAYERMISALESPEYFEALAASSIFGALGHASSNDAALREQVEQIMQACPESAAALDHINQGGRHRVLMEQVLAMSMNACVQGVVASNCERWDAIHRNIDVADRAVSSLPCEEESKLNRLQKEVQRLKLELRQRHTVMCKMVAYLKLESSPAVEEALPAIVRSGWDSVQWKNNYSLLHYAADCVDDPGIVELVALLATDVDKKDDTGKSALDYAAGNKSCAGVKHVLKRLSQAKKTAQSAELAAPRKVAIARTETEVQETSGPKSEAGQTTSNADSSEVVSPEEAQLRAALGKFFRRKRVQSVFSAGIDLLKQQARAREKDPDELGLTELRSELKRLKAENSKLHGERQRRLADGSQDSALGPKKTLGGPLGEMDLQKYLTQLQAFGREAVFLKLMEPSISGGLDLDETESLCAMDQLGVAQRLLLGVSAGKQRRVGEFDASRCRPSNVTEMGSQQPMKSESIERPEDAPSDDAVKEQPPSKAKGKGSKATSGGVKGGKSAEAKGKAVAPKGKGKGKKEGGDTHGSKEHAPVFNKPVVVPSASMKPLWWKNYVIGKHVQKGETVWDNVGDDLSQVPIDDLVDRFSKTKAAEKESQKKVVTTTQAAAIKMLRVITDTQVVVGREAALKKLPAAQDIACALEELNEDVLTLERLQLVQDNACPTDAQLKQLAALREQNPDIPMALPEQYMWVIGQLPAYQQRLECWSFVRAFGETHQLYMESLGLLEPVFDCFAGSESLPVLLGIVLAIGNYLNGSTNRGQADGFDLETLGKLDSVKDAEGKDLRHFIFNTFINQMEDKARSVVQDLGPCLSNVTRRVIKDSDGVEALSKTVRMTLEDIDIAINTVQAEFVAKKEMMHMVLQYIDDPADTFKLQMPEKFSEAMKLVEDLVSNRNRVKDKYLKLLGWFKVAGAKSGDFCLLWDNFLIPGDMIMNKPERVRKDVLIPKFCNSKPIDFHDFAMLWGARQPQKNAGARTSGALPRTSNAARRRARGACKAVHGKAVQNQEGKKVSQKVELLQFQFTQRLMTLAKRRKAAEEAAQKERKSIETSEAAQKFGRLWASKLKHGQSQGLPLSSESDEPSVRTFAKLKSQDRLLAAGLVADE